MNLLDCLYLPAAILTAPWWMRKQRSGWDERFARNGSLRVPAAAPGVKRVLLHAVSVGEVNTLRGLVPLLAREVEVVVSVSTDTGIARARALWPSGAALPGGGAASAGVNETSVGSGPSAGQKHASLVASPPGRAVPLKAIHVVRYPLDFSGAVRRFLDGVRPDAVGLVELELWPNFIGACRRRGIPVAVINGRLSARSFKNYRKFRPVLRSTFGSLSLAAVQDEDYAQRFRHMGVAAERVRVTGSMKWDSVRVPGEGETVPAVAGAEELRAALGIDASKPLVVAGSTGAMKDRGEEALLDRVCGADVQLMCAPRKIERFDEAFREMGGDASCVRRSLQKATGQSRAVGPTRFLLDTIGELRAAYSLADVCIVGRSFGDLYGSDPIEPISLGKATIIGPSYSDFASIVEEFKRAGGGGIVVCGVDELKSTMRDLLASPEKRRELAERGLACIRANQGATRRHADMLLELVKAGAAH